MTDHNDRFVGVARSPAELRKKFDLQLKNAINDEDKLALILQNAKIELKTETHLWEFSGNLCIEYKRGDEKSGISTTEADFWIHELRDDDGTLVYLMFPIERLKTLFLKKWGSRTRGGDNGLSRIVLLNLHRDIFPRRRDP